MAQAIGESLIARTTVIEPDTVQQDEEKLVAMGKTLLMLVADDG